MAESVSTPPTGNVVQTTTLVLQPVPVQKTKVNYKSKASTIIGIVQIVSGGIILVLYGLSYATLDGNDYMEMQIATGVVAAISFLFFSLSGGLAICAANRRSPCLITANMVLAIITSLAAPSLFSCALVSCLMKLPSYYQEDSDAYYEFDQESYELNDTGSSTTIGSNYRYLYDYDTGSYPPHAFTGLFCFIMFLSLVEFVAAIWSSSLACGVMCCSSTTKVIMFGNVEDRQRYIITVDGQAMLAAPSTSEPPVTQVASLTGMKTSEGDEPPPYDKIDSVEYGSTLQSNFP